MSNAIQIRVCLAVVEENRLLLVPHYKTDVAVVQWVIPGGKVEFSESLHEAAVREFLEETGLKADVTGLLDVSEVILLDRPYHSITISFSGKIMGGELRSEPNHPYGYKLPKWFSTPELKNLYYHPEKTVKKVLGI